jgi:hypothetical protein
MKKLFLSLSLIVFAVIANAQSKKPQASPEQTIKQDFGLSTVEITYCRPSVKGRVIFGDLVPYGEVWRTGANAPTRIIFNTDVKIAGQSLKAGEYELFTVPGKEEWEIIFSKETKGWGSSDYKKEDDALRVKVKPSTQALKTEMFTIMVDNVTAANCEIHLVWDNLLVNIPVSNN